MSPGKVEGIYIAPARGVPTVLVEQVHVVPGMGIVGDRYYGLPIFDGKPPKPGRELTLIEIEAIEAIRQEDGVSITAGQTRRNIVTQGISLNNLVDKSFFIGSVQVRGIRLCEPCSYLAERTYPRILQSLEHRGGLRVEIITEGDIHVNDTIIIPEEENK